MKDASISKILGSVALVGSVASFAALGPGNAIAAENHMTKITNRWVVENALIGLSASCAIGDQVQSAAAGVANASLETDLTTDHVFQIGSVAKTFTATAIVNLVADGQLSFEDSLSGWFPDYPNSEDITVRQLLNMTAGTFDYFRAEPENPVISMVMQDVRRIWSPDEVIAIAADQPPHAEAGDVYAYSNTNYLLLGKIVEKVSGMALGRYFDKHFYVPVGLSQTRLTGEDNPTATMAAGYLSGSTFLFGREEPFSSKPADIAGLASLGWSAGGMTTTGADLARWGHALFTGEIVNDRYVTEMTTSTPQSIADNAGYGLGVEHFETSLGLAYGHSGSIPGYASLLVYFPDTHAAVALLTNDETGEPLLLDIAANIASNGCPE